MRLRHLLTIMEDYPLAGQEGQPAPTQAAQPAQPAQPAQQGHDVWGQPAPAEGHQTMAGRVLNAPGDTIRDVGSWAGNKIGSMFGGSPAKATAPAAQGSPFRAEPVHTNPTTGEYRPDRDYRYSATNPSGVVSPMAGMTPQQINDHDRFLAGTGYTMHDLGTPEYKNWHNWMTNDYSKNLPPGTKIMFNAPPPIDDPATAAELARDTAATTGGDGEGALPISWWTDKHQNALDKGFWTPGSPNYKNVSALRGEEEWKPSTPTRNLGTGQQPTAQAAAPMQPAGPMGDVAGMVSNAAQGVTGRRHRPAYESVMTWDDYLKLNK